MHDAFCGVSFNPLTGISSILTDTLGWGFAAQSETFQSPDGDFVYSDARLDSGHSGLVIEFQSPDGDFVYSDEIATLAAILTWRLFQSPDGDFVYSDKMATKTKLRTVSGFNPLTGISSILTDS